MKGAHVGVVLYLSFYPCLLLYPPRPCADIVYPGGNTITAFKAEFDYAPNCADLAKDMPDEHPDLEGTQKDDFKFVCCTQAQDQYFRPEDVGQDPNGFTPKYFHAPLSQNAAWGQPDYTSMCYWSTCSLTVEKWEPEIDPDTDRPVFGGYQIPYRFYQKKWKEYPESTEGAKQKGLKGKYGQFHDAATCSDFCTAFAVQQAVHRNQWYPIKNLPCKKYRYASGNCYLNSDKQSCEKNKCFWDPGSPKSTDNGAKCRSPPASELRPLQKCTTTYLQGIMNDVMMGKSSKFKEEVQGELSGFDGFGVTDWTPINVYGGLKGGYPSDKRVQGNASCLNTTAPFRKLLTPFLTSRCG